MCYLDLLQCMFLSDYHIEHFKYIQMYLSILSQKKFKSSLRILDKIGSRKSRQSELSDREEKP